MIEVNEIMTSANVLGACQESWKVSNWKSLVWMFFTPQGREFCEKNNFPSLNQFRGMSDEITNYGVYVDSGNISRSNDKDIALIGTTSAELTYSGVEYVHKIILMHGAKARIKASNYAVILLVNIGNCEVEFEKDDTVVIL